MIAVTGGALLGEGGEAKEEAKDIGEEGRKADGEAGYEVDAEVLPRSVGQ